MEYIGKIPLFIVLTFFFQTCFNVNPIEAALLIVPRDYNSIQKAIDKASRGDEIIVEDGRYAENVIITKAIILKTRNGAKTTVIEAADADKPVILIKDATGVTINGFTVKGSAAPGIHLLRANASTVGNNISTGNYIGIYLENSPTNRLTKNSTVENVEGITLHLSDGNVLEENNADSNSEKGLVLISSNRNTLERNTANSNYWNGITLWSSNGNVLTDNRALKNTYGMVISNSENNLLKNNITMRRLYFLLPVALVYLGIVFYFIEKKFLIMYYSRKK